MLLMPAAFLHRPGTSLGNAVATMGCALANKAVLTDIPIDQSDLDNPSIETFFLVILCLYLKLTTDGDSREASLSGQQVRYN